MAKRHGGLLALTIATVAIAVMRGWSLDDEDVTTDSTAAGDAAVDRDSLRGDHTLEWNSLVEIATPYVFPGNVRGSKVAWAGKLVAADTNGVVSSTSLCTRFRIEAVYDGQAELSGRLQSAGVALTYDTSPAT